jgi:hypothetical protein
MAREVWSELTLADIRQLQRALEKGENHFINFKRQLPFTQLATDEQQTLANVVLKSQQGLNEIYSTTEADEEALDG